MDRNAGSQARDTFADGSDRYARSRPNYPKELYDWILANTPGREVAWDCATGNGQSAVGLAPHFKRVQATDLSPEQVAQSIPAANVVYSAQPAEKTSFMADTFDLITVAQALHWFDLPQFWREVGRVAKPGALFCAWGYAWVECDSVVQLELLEPIRKLLGPFWAPENQILWRGYRDEDIAFPYNRLATPSFSIQTRWTVSQLVEYVGTWSAFKLAVRDGGASTALRKLTDDAQTRLGHFGPLEIRMPLTVVAGQVTRA